MKVLVSDLFVGDCEFSQKTGVEVVRVQFEERPEVTVNAADLLRLLRFHKKQSENTAGLASRQIPAGSRNRSPDPSPKGEIS